VSKLYFSFWPISVIDFTVVVALAQEVLWCVVLVAALLWLIVANACSEDKNVSYVLSVCIVKPLNSCLRYSSETFDHLLHLWPPRLKSLHECKVIVGRVFCGFLYTAALKMYRLVQTLLPNVVGWLTFLLRIRGVPGSDLGPATGYPYWGSSWFFQVPSGECRDGALKSGHYCFLQYPFQLIIHF
jgi:hypothetical protein